MLAFAPFHGFIWGMSAQYLAVVANACVIRQEFDLAERYLADVKAIVGHENEPTFLAELLRLGGLLLKVRGQTMQAKTKLNEAIVVADSQQANGFKLRASRDLARILAEDGDVEGARNVLAPIYAWFTEGFDTPDLKQAKALLDRLSP